MKIKYNKSSRLRTIADVKEFFRYLAEDLQISFHPDDSFSEITDYQTLEFLFSPEEANILDDLMDDARTVCAENELDIYELAYDAGGWDDKLSKDERTTVNIPVDEGTERNEKNDFYTWVQPDMIEKIGAVIYELGITPDADFGKGDEKPWLDKIVAILKSGKVGD